MGEIKCRKGARIVSIVQLVLLTLYLPFTIITGYFLILRESGGKWDSESEEESQLDIGPRPTPPPHNKQVFNVILPWYNWLWMVIGTILEFTAALKLFEATKIGIDLQEASTLCKFWRGVVLLVALIGLITCVVNQEWIEFVVELLINLVMLGVVSRYMRGIAEAQEVDKLREWQNI